MRFYTLMPLLASAAIASGTLTGGSEGAGHIPTPATDDLLDTYAYNPEETMATVPASFGDYAAIDDLEFGIQIGSYTCWGVTTGSPPVELELIYVQDDNGYPTGIPISQSLYTSECTDSGFLFAGYTVWKTVIEVSPHLYVDTPCWLGSHRSDGISWYPTGGLSVNNSQAHRTTSAGWNWVPFSDTGLEYADLFKIVEPPPVSLDRNTWAGIKRTFTGGNE